MPTPVQDAAVLVVFPVLAATVGALVAAVRVPGPRLTSAVQHFAAGVVLAAVAGEVLPDLHERAGIGITAIGFTAGVALMMLLKAVVPSGDDAASPPSGSGRLLPPGAVLIVGVDLLVDGLLIGIGVALGGGAGVILTAALTLEVLFLGLAVTTTMLRGGSSGRRAAVTTIVLALGMAVTAVLGALVLNGVSDAVQGLVLAFAAAALLWLVVEELLVEAHEAEETSILTGMFFLGFLALYALESVA